MVLVLVLAQDSNAQVQPQNGKSGHLFRLCSENMIKNMVHFVFIWRKFEIKLINL